MAYLDGELSPADAAEMAAHLAQCRTCQETAADMQAVSRQLAGWSTETTESGNLPPKILTGLAERAAGNAKRPKPTWSWLLTHRAWAAGAAVIVVIVLVDVFHPATQKRLISVADPYAPNVPVRQALAQPPGVIAGVIGGVVTPSPETQLLVRTADLSLTARDFDNIRAKLDRIILQFGGLVGELNLNSPNGEARTLNASIHIPAAQLEAALVEVRKLGHVDGESQRGEDVTRQSVDLTARLANLRHTEERLTEILRTRTGKLSDVLEVEEKLDQVRGQIEQSEAEQKALNNRVSFATLSLTVTEDYAKAVSTGLGGAALGGLHHASNVIVAIARAALEAGPTVLLFALLLGLPAYLLWKNFRHAR